MSRGKPSSLMSDVRTMTQQELVEEATRRFGADPMTFAFTCPICGDIATLADFDALGVEPGRAGQECIGRARREKGLDGRGCDFAAYGLIPAPWTITYGQGKSFRAFPLAPAPDPLVWVAVRRKAVEYHGFDPDAPATRCNRSMRTGTKLARSQAVDEHDATQCKSCFPVDGGAEASADA